MSGLVGIEKFDNFKEIRNVEASSITDAVVKTVRSLDERKELEPYVLSILMDSNDTPHGPAEIADILTHKLTLSGKEGLAAFILKGKSFPTVRPAHVSHQIYRLKKVAGLKFAVLAASGTVLDGAKEQFVSTATEIGCAYSILDAIDLGRLLVAHGFICPRDGRRIIAGKCRCGYSPPKRILNVLQLESLNALKECHELGQRAGLIVLPTGSGKTRIAAEDAARQKAKSVLYVAHRHEILDIAESEFVAKFGLPAVKRHGSRTSISKGAIVNLSTIQLLHASLDVLSPKAFDYVVIDEFHHSACVTYRRLIDTLKPAFLLGLTATPFRSDRQDILELCGNNILVNFELRSGIDVGILAPYHYYGCFDDVDYSDIRHNGTKYDVRDLEKALIIPRRDFAIISKWREHAGDKPSLAFCCSHLHAERVAKHFNEKNIPAALYVDSVPMDKRRELVDKLAAGTIKVLCVVDVLNEGIDIPFVECLLFLRPTESKLLFYQQLGRGLRRYVGKSHCVVIDFIGNFKNAYKIIEYQPLLSSPEEETATAFSTVASRKQLLNLPLGCEVKFDEKVVEIFSGQTLDPRFASRHNIGRILLYEYDKLRKFLKRSPTARDLDRYHLLDSTFYIKVFGSWSKFQKIIQAQ